MTDIEFDKITNNLFHGCEKWMDECPAYFCDVTGDELVDLIFAGVLYPKAKPVYYGPTAEEITTFVNDHPDFTCHGIVTVDEGVPTIKIQGLYCGSGFSDWDKLCFEDFSKTSDVLRSDLSFLYSRWN